MHYQKLQFFTIPEIFVQRWSKIFFVMYARLISVKNMKLNAWINERICRQTLSENPKFFLFSFEHNFIKHQ